MATAPRTGQYAMIPDLELASTVNGQELLEIVQGGKSKHILVESLRVIGQDGLSAYEVAVKNGFVGTEQEWVKSLTGKSAFEIAQELDPSINTPEKFIASLKGDKGYSAYEIAQMNNPNIGTEEQWLASLFGDDGKSAYEVAVANGFIGDEPTWLATLIGASAYEDAVEKGFLGTLEEWLDSLVGLSAYEVAKENGFNGTPAEWLESLRGAQGAAGKSAYQVAVDNGYQGTEAEWLEELGSKMTQENLQALLNEYDWTFKGVLTALDRNGGFVGNSAHLNFLFLYDKRGLAPSGIPGDPQASPQYRVEAGRMQTEGYSYWKNDPATNTTPDGPLPKLPDSEVRLYDDGRLQVGSMTKYIEFKADGKIKIADGAGGEKEIDVSEAAKSAYELALEEGFEGTMQEWLESLKGADGAKGDKGDKGLDGKSAYDVAVDEGFSGDEAAWLDSLKGTPGEPGGMGEPGARGKSAYEVAVDEGFVGDEAAWLASLKGIDGVIGRDGDDGLSAYAVAVENGFVGDEAQWLASLKGEKGDAGQDGAKGDKGDTGPYTRIVGHFDDVSELPDPVTSPPENAYLVSGDFYANIDGGWEFMGSVRGQDGIGLRVLGSFPTVGELPTEDNANGDTYIVGGSMYVWVGDKWEPVGQVGPKGDKGDKGEKGDKGDKGLKGDPSNSIKVNGKADSVGELPPEAAPGDGYIVGLNLWVKMDDNTWFDAGQYAGKSAYEMAVDAGFVGDEAAWLASLKGAKGDKGDTGEKGADGTNGTDGAKGADGADGADGKSAYQIAVDGGFNGTEAEWIISLRGPKGEQGAGLIIEGTKDSVDDLPADGEIGDAWIVAGDVWLKGPEGWYNAGPMGGVDGLSAYQVAVKNGFVGDEEAWLASLKGAKGDAGEDGADLAIKGKIADEAAFPGDAVAGDAYIAEDNGHLYVKGSDGVVFDAGPLAGDSAYEVAVQNGFVGDEVAWLASLKGKDGTNGTNGTDGAAGEKGADGKDGADGTNGASAYDIAVAEGFVGDEATWLASLKGVDGASFHTVGVFDDPADLPPPEAGAGAYVGAWVYAVVAGTWMPIVELKGRDGESAYEIAVRETSFEGTEVEWLASLKGEQGEKGEMGPALKILGEKNSSAELPATGALGDGYLINGDFWGWTGTEFVNMGPIKGPKGDQGIQGIQGKQGIQGPKGDKGASILYGEGDPVGTDGRVQDMWINTSTRSYWLKTGSLAWTLMGQFGGGDVNSPTDDGKYYLRKYNQWVETTLTEAPDDAKRYVRRSKQWVEFTMDRYDTRVATTTGEIDFALATTFIYDNTVGNTTRAISAKNMPTGRSQVAILVIKGSAGQFTWPTQGWNWNGGKVPPFGANQTTLVLFYDGTSISVGAGPTF